MGMCAQIIAIGSFSRELTPFLEYPADHYARTIDGATISRSLFGIIEGSGLSRELASLFGITDPWDFNQHKIVTTKVNLAGLREFAKRYPDYAADVEARGADESSLRLPLPTRGVVRIVFSTYACLIAATNAGERL